jgi:hypothetical protein
VSWAQVRGSGRVESWEASQRVEARRVAGADMEVKGARWVCSHDGGGGMGVVCNV